MAAKKREENLDMSNSESRADKAALELLKQLITLSSGVLALSATFITRLNGINDITLILLACSWVLLLISVFFSIQSISCIVPSRLSNNHKIWSEGYGRVSGMISKYCFFAGILIFVFSAFLYLLQATDNDTNHSNHNKDNIIEINNY